VDDVRRGIPPSSETRLNLIVAGDVTPLEHGARVVPLDGATPVRIRWSAGIRATYTERALDDPMLSDVWGERLTRIELHPGSLDRTRITVERDIAPMESSEDDR